MNLWFDAEAPVEFIKIAATSAVHDSFRGWGLGLLDTTNICANTERSILIHIYLYINYVNIQYSCLFNVDILKKQPESPNCFLTFFFFKKTVWKMLGWFLGPRCSWLNEKVIMNGRACPLPSEGLAWDPFNKKRLKPGSHWLVGGYTHNWYPPWN